MPKKQKQKKIELPHKMVFALLREPVRLCRKPVGWLFRKMRHPPILTRLILLNIIALLVFFVGISMFSQYQRGLSEAYRQSLLTQALIISGALGEAATDEEEAKRSSRKKKDDTELIYPNFEPNAAALILRRLITPTRTRARLYDREGNLILDSEYVRGAGSVVSFELEPPTRRKGINLLGWFEKNIMQGFAEQKPSMSNEMAKDGLQFAEVVGAFGGKNQAKDRVNEEGQIIVNVAVPVQRYRAIIGVLMLSTRGGDIDGLVHEQWMALFQIFLIALVMSLIFSFVLALSIARPLRRLARAASSLHSVKERKKRPRLPDLSYRGDEIGELSAALMEMTDALWERVESIEAFAADVAHELKNPLTSLQSAIETMTNLPEGKDKKKLFGIIQEDVARMNRLISDISRASALDARLALAPKTALALGAFMEKTIPVLQDAYASHKNITIVFEKAEGDYTVFAEQESILRILQNLLTNAISFSPKGGEITVRLSREGGEIVLEVADQGVGVPAQEAERIFERFYTRRPEDKSGTATHSGLGLSIARQIALAHQGSLVLKPSKKGACFVLTLPAQAPISLA